MRSLWGQGSLQIAFHRIRTPARPSSSVFALWTLCESQQGFGAGPFGRPKANHEGTPRRKTGAAFLGHLASGSSLTVLSQNTAGTSTLAQPGRINPRHAFGGHLGFGIEPAEA